MSKHPIRICFVISSLANEGPTNIMYNIIKYMNRTIFDVHIITLVEEKSHSRFNDFKSLGLNIIKLTDRLKNNSGAISKIKGFRKVISELKPEVVHSHCPRSLIYISTVQKKIKTVYTAHIFPGIQTKALYGNIKGTVVIKVSNYLMRKVDLAIACSESVSQEFKDVYGWKVMAINNGCSLNVWEQNEDEKKSLRDQLKFRDGIKYFLFIGRFSAEKNPQLLINAFEKLNRTDCCLVMLGQGPLFSQFNELNHNNVRIEGFKDNVQPYLKACDYYISASSTEGLANTLLESMSAGLPLLLSNIPSHNSVITNSSRHLGFLFLKNSVEDLISKMSELLELDRKIISSNVQNEYTEKYTAKMMSQNYSDAYVKLAISK
ncbi:MAG: glycosyltransferase [Bacteroidetes bacterium]|nr:MAG: glycosyltransferase [Bacteroidota bacterium]